jgi:hypothetical protein
MDVPRCRFLADLLYLGPQKENRIITRYYNDFATLAVFSLLRVHLSTADELKLAQEQKIVYPKSDMFILVSIF